MNRRVFLASSENSGEIGDSLLEQGVAYELALFYPALKRNVEFGRDSL
jgi:hypothetical protein